jgi:hypothetical protein
MPCDNNSKYVINNEYEDVMNSVECSMALSNCEGIIVCGDLNTCFTRNNAQTMFLNQFIGRNNLRVAWDSDVACQDFTYNNYSLNHHSCIDHFLVSANLFDAICDHHVIYDIDNVSNHSVVTLNMSINCVYTSNRTGTNPVSHIEKCDWGKATACDIGSYKAELDTLLCNIIIPDEVITCDNVMCTNADHINCINNLCNDIITCCISASNKCIPIKKGGSNARKVIPEWTDRVKPSREVSLLWHKIWVDSGKPIIGYVYDIKKSTRHKYHYAIRDGGNGFDSDHLINYNSTLYLI